MRTLHDFAIVKLLGLMIAQLVDLAHISLGFMPDLSNYLMGPTTSYAQLGGTKLWRKLTEHNSMAISGN
jgi:hypothetical protein